MIRKKTLRLLPTAISRLLVTIRYIGLSKANHLTTLRLFHDYFIGETTIIGYDYSSRNATTIADLYWLSGANPKRDTAGAVNGSAPPAVTAAAGLPRRMEGARLQAAGLAWSAMRCTGWHESTTGARRCTLIYIIIIGGCVDLYSVRRGVGSSKFWRASGRCDTLQRGAGGIIAAFVGLVSRAVEWGISQEKRL